MKPNLIIIDSTEKLLELRDFIVDYDFVAYDSETTGLTQQHQVIGFSVCMSEKEAFYVILDKCDPIIANQFLELLTMKKLLMHNGVFDCMMAESNFKVRLIDSLHSDTMILAHLLNENRRVGLKELAKDLYGEDSTQEHEEMHASVIANGGIWTAKNKEMYKADPYILGKYGAKDAWLTYKLFLDLVPELYEQGLDKFFYEEESMPLLRGPTYELNTTGLQVDGAKLSQLKKTLEAECLEAKEFIHSEINSLVKEKYPKGFNIGASQQLSWLMFGKMQLEFDRLTPAGKTVCKAMGLKLPYTRMAKRDFIAICENRVNEEWKPGAIVNGKAVKPKKIADPWKYIACDKRTLQKFESKYRWIAKLLEYQRKKKLLNTYVEGIEERVQYGIIRPSFLQHGTTSGRYAARNPNFQNLPRDDKRIKECVVARGNNVYVGSDFSQLEPRVFSSISGDARLSSAFNGKSDFYSVVGREVYDKLECDPSKEGTNAFGSLYPTLRQDSKVFTLAATYGATGSQLAPLMNKSIEAAQYDIDNYFEKFPAVRTMMLDSHEFAKKHGYVTNLFGRRRRIPEAMKINRLFGNIPHAELPYEARTLLNLSVNHRIQSTAASIVNRAMIKLYDNIRAAGIENCKIVLQIHDEIIVECREEDAANVSLLLRDSMENTTILEGVKLEAIPRITKTLAK